MSGRPMTDQEKAWLLKRAARRRRQQIARESWAEVFSPRTCQPKEPPSLIHTVILQVFDGGKAGR